MGGAAALAAGADAARRLGRGGGGLSRGARGRRRSGAECARPADPRLSTAIRTRSCPWRIRAPGSGGWSTRASPRSTSSIRACGTTPGTSRIAAAPCSTGSTSSGAIAFPERVRLVTRSYRDASAYWVRIDGLTPGTPRDRRCAADGAGEIVGRRRSNVDGFTLTLDRPAALVTVDGAAVRVAAGGRRSRSSRAAGKWRAGPLRARRQTARRGGSDRRGRAADATFTSTAAPARDRRRTAKRGSKSRRRRRHGRAPRRACRLSFPVKADTAVTPEDLDSADLVLFGTRETNSLIARFAPAAAAGAERRAPPTTGCCSSRPSGKHYALVSSGLPWWTGADDAQRGGPPLAPEQYRLLSTFGDYILFKGRWRMWWPRAALIQTGRFRPRTRRRCWPPARSPSTEHDT